MIVVLLGAPGSGKGTQAKKISQDFSLGHLSTGDLLRAEIDKNTPLGRKVRDVLQQGGYVDDACIVELLDQNFDSFTEGYQGCVLDGLPRTLGQAEALDAFLQSRGICVDVALHVEVDDTELMTRLTGRFVCKKCSAVYHKKFKPTKIFGVCDACASQDFYIREDDHPDLIMKRLATHHAQIKPLLKFYNDKGLLRTVDGSQEILLVSRLILEILGRVQSFKK